MLRSGPARSLARSALRSTNSRGSRKTSQLSIYQSSKCLVSRIERLRGPVSLALTTYRPLSTSLQQYAAADTKSSGAPFDHIDTKYEEEVARAELQPHPEEVSEDSSVHQVFHEKNVPDPDKDEDMLAGVYSDLVRVPPLVTEVRVKFK